MKCARCPEPTQGVQTPRRHSRNILISYVGKRPNGHYYPFGLMVGPATGCAENLVETPFPGENEARACLAAALLESSPELVLRNLGGLVSLGAHCFLQSSSARVYCGMPEAPTVHALFSRPSLIPEKRQMKKRKRVALGIGHRSQIDCIDVCLLDVCKILDVLDLVISELCSQM